jgi:hypothetical protein
MLQLLINPLLTHYEEEYGDNIVYRENLGAADCLYATVMGLSLFAVVIGCRFFIGDYFDRAGKKLPIKKSNSFLYRVDALKGKDDV